MNACFPSNQADYTLIFSLIEEAYKRTSEDYGVIEAVEWAQDFQFPEEVWTRDHIRLSAHQGSLQNMTESLHKTSSEHRLTSERVMNSVPVSDSDYERMIRLARGIEVLVSTDFSPNGRPKPLRNLYTRVAPAVNKMMYDLWKEDEIFILPTSEVRRLSGVHFSPIHWTTKHGKRQGRPLTDCSDGDPPLNSDEVRAKMSALYGEIDHPTLQTLITMILDEATFDQERDEYDFSHLTLWKEDLASAFSLLNFSPDSVTLMACELTDGLTMIYHTGSFGWTGTPFAFQVVTRVIKRLLNDGRLHGRADMYVDDMLGVCKKIHSGADTSTAKSTAHKLLGNQSISDPKGECKSRCVWLGWCIDLDKRLVTISRKNFLKTLYLFFDVDTESKVQGIKIECLASLASRNSEVLRMMRPYSSALYHETVGMRSHLVFKNWTSEGRLAVWMWRIALCLLNLEETTYARSLSSFRTCKSDTTIKYDASLTGIGIIVSIRDRLSVAGKFDFSFQLHTQSKYQNSVEFIAVVAAVLYLVQQKMRGCRLRLIGDSKSSLKWGHTERFKGVLGQKAAIVFILLGIHFDIEVVESEHIAGSLNVVCDKLSRGVSPSALGFETNRQVSWPTEETDILNSLDPTDPIESEFQLTQFWKRISENIEKIKKRD